MIQLSLTQALALYSAVVFGLFAAIWTYTEVTTRQTYRSLAKQFLWRCPFCGYTYLDEAAEHLSQCPRCGSYMSEHDATDRAASSKAKQAVQKADTESDAETRRNPSRRKRPGQRRRGPRRRR